MVAAKQGLIDDPWQTYWPPNTFGLMPIQITRGFGAVYRPEESRRWVPTLLFLSRSAMIKASSSDWEALSLGSQCVWYRELKSSKVTVRDPPMHSVTFWPVISRWIPPGWLPSCSCTSKNARPSAYKQRQYDHQDLEKREWQKQKKMILNVIDSENIFLGRSQGKRASSKCYSNQDHKRSPIDMT
jgi:hypothetical protein